MKNKGIGHATVEKSKALSAANLEWLCLPGAEPELQVSLDKRFRALMANA
jgi:hypothetical protein